METSHRNSGDKRLRKRLIQQIEAGRLTLLILAAVSLVNQILLICNVNYHLLLSMASPYYLNWLNIELSKQGSTGVYGFFAVLLTIVVYIALLACWLMSGQSKQWLAAAFGIYALDTVLLVVFTTLLKNPASCLLEVVTHCVVLAVLYNALRSAEKLSKLPRRRRVRPEENVPIAVE